MKDYEQSYLRFKQGEPARSWGFPKWSDWRGQGGQGGQGKGVCNSFRIAIEGKINGLQRF